MKTWKTCQQCRFYHQISDMAGYGVCYHHGKLNRPHIMNDMDPCCDEMLDEMPEPEKTSVVLEYTAEPLECSTEPVKSRDGNTTIVVSSWLLREFIALAEPWLDRLACASCNDHDIPLTFETMLWAYNHVEDVEVDEGKKVIHTTDIAVLKSVVELCRFFFNADMDLFNDQAARNTRLS